MEGVKIEGSISNICYGCLSRDRRTSHLGEYAELFTSFFGNYKQYATEEIKFCWECMAVIRKFKSFQTQLKQAQDGLLEMLHGSTPETLSNLTTVNNYYLDLEIEYSQTRRDNSVQIHEITFPVPFLKTEEVESNLQLFKNIQGSLHHDTETRLDITWNEDAKPISENSFIDNDSNCDYKDNLSITNGDDEVKYQNDDSAEMVDQIRSEDDSESRPKRSRPYTSDCVDNCVGYYRKYAKLVKTEKRDWGSWDDVKKHFRVVNLSEKEMEDHFLKKDRCNKSYSRMPYRCEICTLGYLNEGDLKRHNDLNHYSSQNFKCSHCKTKTPTLEELNTHWRTHSVAYKCKRCNGVCKEKFMRKHLDHAHTKMFACTVCNVKFRVLKTFTKHYKECHMQYTCDYCNATYRSKKKIEKHIINQHTSVKCTDCNRTYKTHLLYRRHCFAHHPDRVTRDHRPELAFCVECNKQFASVYLYRIHLKVSPKHAEIKRVRIPCPDCGKIFARKNNLNNHYNLVHKKKSRFHCELCDKYFVRPAGLRLHKNNVHLKVDRPKDKICDLCGRGFHNNVVLRNHRRTHTGERPHQCPHCAAQFIQKYAMQTHVRTQHKEYAKDLPPVTKRPRPAVDSGWAGAMYE